MKQYYMREEVKEMLHTLLTEKESPWKRPPEHPDDRIQRFKDSAKAAMIKKERHFGEMHTHLKLANDPDEPPKERRLHGMLSALHRMAGEGQEKVEQKYRNGDYDADWEAEEADKNSKEANDRSDAFYMARKMFTGKDAPAK